MNNKTKTIHKKLNSYNLSLEEIPLKHRANSEHENNDFSAEFLSIG